MKVTRRGDCVIVEVHAVPRAASTRISGVHDGRVKVALAAPPADGAANAALIAFFADGLGIPKRDVELLAGATSRRKTLAIRGVELERVRAWLEAETGA